jgi:hypothetical protein
MIDTQAEPSDIAGPELHCSVEEAIDELQTSLPEQVERGEVISLCRLYASLAAIQYAAEAQASAERAVAEIENARSMIRQMRALMRRTENEAHHILDVLFRDFRISEDPAYAALHRALVGLMHAP